MTCRSLLAIVALLLSFNPVDTEAREAARPTNQIWLTTGAQPGPRLQPLSKIAWSSAVPAGPLILVDTGVKYRPPCSGGPAQIAHRFV